MEKKRCEAIEKKFTKRVDTMSKGIEELEGRVETLTEKVWGMKKILKDSQLVDTDALRRSNLNEHNPRKTYFKMMGVPAEEKENTWELL